MDDQAMVAGDGWISDDSSFYGDESEQERLETLCEEFDPAISWSMRKNELNAIAFQHRSIPQRVLSNPGEGQPGCWQLGETASDFIERLPPTTTSRMLHEWIWVHNPHQQGHRRAGPAHTHDFTVRGEALLAESRRTRENIKMGYAKSVDSIVARRLDEESELLRSRISNLAAETGVLAGKWMLFLSVKDLDRVWRLVVDGVINNRLGPTAKVTPDEGRSGERLICVYTNDFRDEDDIKRVLRELISIGAVEQGKRAIHYKPDPYTYLDIYRETAAEYGLQASLYSSQMLLTEKQGVLTPRTPSSLNWPIKAAPRDKSGNILPMNSYLKPV